MKMTKGTMPKNEHGSAPSSGGQPTASRKVDLSFSGRGNLNPSKGWNGNKFTPETTENDSDKI